MKIRSILDRLLYNRNYEQMVKNMSNSNIGGHKNRNIQDHLFVINATVNEIIKSKGSADIQIVDVQKCFNKFNFFNLK